MRNITFLLVLIIFVACAKPSSNNRNLPRAPTEKTKTEPVEAPQAVTQELNPKVIKAYGELSAGLEHLMGKEPTVYEVAWAELAGSVSESEPEDQRAEKIFNKLRFPSHGLNQTEKIDAQSEGRFYTRPVEYLKKSKIKIETMKACGPTNESFSVSKNEIGADVCLSAWALRETDPAKLEVKSFLVVTEAASALVGLSKEDTAFIVKYLEKYFYFLGFKPAQRIQDQVFGLLSQVRNILEFHAEEGLDKNFELTVFDCGMAFANTATVGEIIKPSGARGRYIPFKDEDSMLIAGNDMQKFQKELMFFCKNLRDKKEPIESLTSRLKELIKELGRLRELIDKAFYG